jgi:hypothetical protein
MGAAKATGVWVGRGSEKERSGRVPDPSNPLHHPAAARVAGAAGKVRESRLATWVRANPGKPREAAEDAMRAEDEAAFAKQQAEDAARAEKAKDERDRRERIGQAKDAIAKTRKRP